MFGATEKKIWLVAFCLALAGPGTSMLKAATLDSEIGEGFVGDQFGWMMAPSMLRTTGVPQNQAALNEVLDLFAKNDSRAGLALQNYIARYPQDAMAFDLAGAVLMQRKDYRNAALSFRKGMLIDPNNSWIRAKFGTAIALAGDDVTAKAELEKVLETNPDNPLALRYLARLAVERGDFPLATLYSERALRVFGLPLGTVNQAHFDLAELYQRTQRFNDVMDLLGPAVRRDTIDLPADAKLDLYGRYMEAGMAAGNIEAARLGYEKLVPLVDTSDPRVKLTEARLLRLEGKFDEGMALLDKIAAEAPDLAGQLRADKALFLAAAGQVDAAAALWMAMAEEQESGNDLPFLREALQVQINAGQPGAAIAAAEKLAADHPERADLRLLELEILGKGGQPAKVQARAQLMTQDFPDNADAYRMLGISAVANKDVDAGIAALRQSLTLDPKQPETWLTLVGAAHGHGTYVGGSGHGGNASHTDVAGLLGQAIAANPAASDLYTELGLLQLSDGNVEAAIASFDDAVKANPGSVAGLSLGALARADIGQDLGVALAMIDRAYAMAPNEPINKDILGWVLARQGATERGLELMLDAAAAEPDDVTISYHLGATYQDMNQTEAAIPYLLAALSAPNYSHNVSDARKRYLQAAPAQSVEMPIGLLNDMGTGDGLGKLTLSQTAEGLAVTAQLANLPPGTYEMHIHEYGTCAPSEDGAPGGKAGGHYGHGESHDHTAAQQADDGHAHDHEKLAEASSTDATAAPTGAMPEGLPVGDLQPFTVAEDGSASGTAHYPALTLDEVRGRSIMVHYGPAFGDLAGNKIGCGIIR